jgi:hypothetical protein
VVGFGHQVINFFGNIFTTENDDKSVTLFYHIYTTESGDKNEDKNVKLFYHVFVTVKCDKYVCGVHME